MKTLMFAFTAFLTAAAWAGDAVVSTVTLDPSASILWKTATVDPAKVSLLWPAGAVSATLVLNPGPSVDITDTSLTEYALEQALPEDETGETVIDLTLTYKDANGAALQTQTATVGFVCGTAASSDIAWRTPDTRKWHRTKALKPVVPVPSDVTALAVDAVAVPYGDVPTWGVLAGTGSGKHVISWTKAGEQDSLDYMTPSGMMILLR